MTKQTSWRSHVILVTLTACAFAVVPFGMRGLDAKIAGLTAMILFPATVVTYLFIMRLFSPR
jgi:hypothetical protein